MSEFSGPVIGSIIIKAPSLGRGLTRDEMDLFANRFPFDDSVHGVRIFGRHVSMWGLSSLYFVAASTERAKTLREFFEETISEIGFKSSTTTLSVTTQKEIVDEMFASLDEEDSFDDDITNTVEYGPAVPGTCPYCGRNWKNIPRHFRSCRLSVV